MSQENVELSQRLTRAWNRRDVEAILAMSDPECVWHPALEGVIDGRAFRGAAGIWEYFEGLVEQGVAAGADLTDFRDLGDCVLGLGRLSFRSASGVELPNQEVACIWQWRDGKCVEAWTWLSHAEALEAVGLSE